MTQATKESIKYNLPTWLTFGNMVLLLGLFYSRGQTDQSMIKNIEANQKAIIVLEKDVNNHKGAIYEHRSMDDLMVRFVPREELEGKFDALFTSQEEIKELIKDNYKK